MPGKLADIQALLQSGDWARVEALCRAALAENPFDAAVMDILGVAARGRGDNLKAVEHFKNAVSLEPRMGLYRVHLAASLRALGRRDEARIVFEDAVASDPTSFEAVYHLSQLLNEMGETERAIDMARRAVKLDPKFAQAHNNLGAFLQGAGKLEEAAAEYRQAIRFAPDHRNAHINLANALAESDRVEDALALIERALRKWPNDVDLLNARCNALMRRNELDRAAAAADAVLAADPGYVQAHYAKGMILLAQGRFEDGWREYEWRVRRAGFGPKRTYAKPRWSGDPMAGKTLLVHWEQGYGDVIQFCRYLPLLRALFATSPAHVGARILFDCPKKLIDLVRTLDACDDIGDWGDEPPSFDAFIPLMSLASILGIDAATIPNHVPYLTPAPADDVAFDDVPDGILKVGLTWASDRGDSYRRKVMHARDLAPLFKVASCRFYGLQFGLEGMELDPYVAAM
jgi:tetratricopeptide (TPR) repeat protein